MADVRSLEEKVRQRGARVHRRAVGVMGVDLDAVVPVGRTGKLRADQRIRHGFSRGNVLASTIEYPSDVASYTEDGTRRHPISGNPILRFYWPRLGRVVYFRHVDWKPGPGVRANRRWFSKAMRPAAWRRALRSAIRVG